jgi:hypothetical protein
MRLIRDLGPRPTATYRRARRLAWKDDRATGGIRQSWQNYVQISEPSVRKWNAPKSVKSKRAQTFGVPQPEAQV